MAELVMKYQQYDQYKKSGIEWVGDIPSHWEETPVFSCFDATSEKNLDGKETNVLSLSYGNIIKRDVDTNFGLLPESFNTYQIVDVGDIILRLTDLQNDKRSLRVGLAKEKGIITSAYLKLKPKDRLDSVFAYRLLHSYDTTKVYYGLGGGLRQSMKFEDFRRLPILVPPYEEQIQINRFLDYEVVRIDTLIKKQQTLIKLLKEKRQAVISHAVTKGLNPDAPMKDSGVEWLGEVPEHWSIPQIGYHSKVTKLTGFEYTNLWRPSIEGSIIALRGFNIQERYLDLSKTEKITEQLSNKLERSKLHEGDIVLPCTGTLGNAALIQESNLYHINQNIAKVSIDKKLFKPEFAVLWMTSLPFRQMIDFNNTSGMQPVLLIGDIRKLPIPLAPLYEQQEIVDFLLLKTEQFDRLIDSAELAIELLQERRTALISAAVTGKIDVRGWRASE